jgi:hypothetical protein
MNNAITQLLIVALAIVPFCTGLTQGVKITFPKLSSRFYPIIAIVIGILLGAISNFITADYTIVQLLISGGIAGMASCGLYDIVITKVTDNK